MARKRGMFVDARVVSGQTWGCDPKPEDHDTFVGWRGIWCPESYALGTRWKAHIDYVYNRSSSYGYERDIDRLIRWWSKRGGAESAWLKSEDRDTRSEPWKMVDPVTGNTAVVRKSYDYVYISLYHDDSLVTAAKGKGDAK